MGIPSIKQILDSHEAWDPTGGQRLYEDWQVEKMLKEYGEAVVEECASEVRDEPWQITKEAVLAVKDLIK